MDMNQIYILTAPSGIGKTTFCRALVEHARAAGWDVAGLLSPAVFENGIKTGILAENLRTGEARPLAQLSTLKAQPIIFNLELGQWLFSPFTLDWGNEIYAASLPCDLFVVDELGPLELIRGEGWGNALEALREATYKVGVVVIRPELVETALQTFHITQVVTIEPSENLAQYANFWWEKMRG